MNSKSDKGHMSSLVARPKPLAPLSARVKSNAPELTLAAPPKSARGANKMSMTLRALRDEAWMIEKDSILSIVISLLILLLIPLLFRMLLISYHCSSHYHYLFL